MGELIVQGAAWLAHQPLLDIGVVLAIVALAMVMPEEGRRR